MKTFLGLYIVAGIISFFLIHSMAVGQCARNYPEVYNLGECDTAPEALLGAVMWPVVLPTAYLVFNIGN